MIIEDYVSFETAKLLKAKGFNSASFYCYEEKEKNGILLVVLFYPLSNSDLDNTIESHKCWSAPTIQVVMKWLREVHNLHCDIGYDFRVGWHNKITSLKETVIDHDIEMKTYLPYKTVNYPSYEDACEDAIKYCLKELI